MDRRQMKSRKAIFTAFEELLETKKYERITVQDIIDRADVGRTTFYTHFETKDGLLDAICQALFVHILDEDLSPEKDHDYSVGEHNLKERQTHILYHLHADDQRYKRLLSGESADLFWNYFRHTFQTEMKDYIQRVYSSHAKKLPPDFFEDFTS